jgi:SAM-dependent methyltransferase
MKSAKSVPTDQMASSIRTPGQYLESWNFAQPKGDHVHIAKLISEHSPGGRLLDLGCGPMLPVWAMFHPRVEEIIGLDRHEDNIAFLRQMASAPDKYKALTQALALARKLNPALPAPAVLSKAAENARLGSVEELQPDWIGKFTVVTQIGCLPCLPTNGEVHQALSHISDYLQPDGVFLSVMWHARPGFIEDPVWGGPERTERGLALSAKDFSELACSHGLDRIFESVVPSEEADKYESMTLQAFRFVPKKARHLKRFGRLS